MLDIILRRSVAPPQFRCFQSGAELHPDAFLTQTVTVRAAGKKITFAARTAPALNMLLSGRPVELADVSAASGVDAAVVAETLIREGLCAELTEALSLGCTGMIPTGG
jgi:hypothetical protein